MPSLGADMESGTLLEWFVKPGDAVKRGDIVALVDTSKAEIEIEIFEDGVIDQLLVSEGMRVPVGTVLATVCAPAAAAGNPVEIRAAVATAAAPGRRSPS
jgi:pyruvate dehydrogenase E2 component (dihydrolipoamide acetyltransferase)